MGKRESRKGRQFEEFAEPIDGYRVGSLYAFYEWFFESRGQKRDPVSMGIDGDIGGSTAPIKGKY